MKLVRFDVHDYNNDNDYEAVAIFPCGFVPTSIQLRTLFERGEQPIDFTDDGDIIDSDGNTISSEDVEWGVEIYNIFEIEDLEDMEDWDANDYDQYFYVENGNIHNVSDRVPVGLDYERCWDTLELIENEFVEAEMLADLEEITGTKWVPVTC